jgi:hypothetical protein
VAPATEQAICSTHNRDDQLIYLYFILFYNIVPPMRTEEFLEPYNRTSTGEHYSIQNPMIDDSRVWSFRMGELLYDRLASPDDFNQAAGVKTLESYIAWLESDFNRIAPIINQDVSEEGLVMSNEINFHRLSMNMSELWGALILPDYLSSKQRFLTATNFAQDNLALSVLRFYTARERTAAASSKYSYFSEENARYRQSREGIANEFDAALVLIELMRLHPELLVVPAPAQFENHTKKYNADFIVLSKEGKTVGVQVKGQVSSEVIAQYDKKRIVLVDGRTDLGNEVYRRTAREKQPQLVSWAGILCTQRAAQFKTHGPGTTKFLTSGSTSHARVMRVIGQSRAMTKGMQPFMKQALNAVGDRVMSKLDEQEEPTALESA